MSAHDVRVRTRHAGAYVRAAIVVLELGDDADEDAIANVVGSLAVLAGIAAADAITGRALGRRSASESHADAVDLLGSLEGDGLAPTLRRLLQAKADAQYSPRLISMRLANDMLGWAQKLLREAERPIG